MLVALDGEPYLFPLLTVAARTVHFMARSYWYPDVIAVGVRRWRFDGSLDVLGDLRLTRARLSTHRRQSPWGAPSAAAKGISRRTCLWASWQTSCCPSSTRDIGLWATLGGR